MLGRVYCWVSEPGWDLVSTLPVSGYNGHTSSTLNTHIINIHIASSTWPQAKLELYKYNVLQSQCANFTSALVVTLGPRTYLGEHILYNRVRQGTSVAVAT